MGERADVVVARHRPELSRRTVKELALQGRLCIDGAVRPPSTRVHQGARLELKIRRPEAAPPELRVVRVTDRFVYVDKPAGLHTHRLGPEDPPALSDAVALAHPECIDASNDPREGGAVHRLDAATSGLVAFARSRRAWLEGRTAVSQDAAKVYIAVVDGRWPPPREGTPTDASVPSPFPAWAPRPVAATAVELSWPLGRGDGVSRVAARADGLSARTWVWPLHSRRDSLQWLALRLLTGRRHQARVHLATAGLPIVGDERYGGSAHPTLLLRAAVLRLDGLDGPVVAPSAEGWPSSG